jgi:dTDP-glucose 4,6-dehydratase
MTSEKMRALGWKPERDFDSELRATVRWYIEHERWWQPITERPDYRDFVARFYGPGLGDDL